MLYSETQLSAGLVSLPLSWINPNPIFSYNVMTILSYFLAGWFMYLLGKYLSKGKEWVSVLAGLIFMLAPYKMAAISHLQNLSIFCLPLAVLLILRFFDVYASPAGRKAKKADKAAKSRRIKLSLSTAVLWSQQKLMGLGNWLRTVYKESQPGRKYIIGLLLTLLYVFFASWVQMVFVLIAVGVLLAVMLLFKLTNWRRVFVIGVTIAVAAAAILPLALEYVQFSNENEATFTLSEQILYSSDAQDYFMPHTGTLLGQLFYDMFPGDGARNSYNPDSYSYHGVTLYIITLVLFVVAFLWRKKSPEHKRLSAVVATFTVLAIVGLIISLGPVLKIHGHSSFQAGSMDSPVAMPMPWLFVDFFLPQLSFIRAIGRASVIMLFALCCLLPLFANYPFKGRLAGKGKQILLVVVSVLLLFELMPAHRVRMASQDYSYNLTIPAVYEYIKEHDEINNIAILSSNDDYPGAAIPIARPEQVMWAGYHNKNIFNGYSGYEPREYWSDYVKMVDFDPATTPAFMKSLGLQYVVVDKQLSGPDSVRPQLLQKVSATFPVVYSDSRYVLFKVIQ